MVELQGATSSSLRFEMLGPLQVRRGEAAVPLGRLQQRVVLSLLLLHNGRPFPRDRLIDAVWGDAAPAYAVNLLQKHVSVLRQTLDPDRQHGHSRLLGWTDAGYVMSVPSGALDLQLFEREVQRARAARSAGDVVSASTSLQVALRLWRGSLCDGLHSPVLDAERERLEELRIGVLEDRFEVDLMLGGKADLIPELRQMVREHPLRERLRAALMLALHRAGRTAEALAAYRETRKQLREELGLDPSPELKRLHERILAGDPDLLTAAVTAAAPSAPVPVVVPTEVPAQLPHRVPDFTGRRPQLQRLNEALASTQTAAQPTTLITAIAGSAGVGKTALAIAWAHEIKDRFPDGQLYVNLRGFDPTGTPTEPGEAVRGFLDAFDVPSQRLPGTTEGQCALFRSLLAERRMLVVLDNARDTDQVRPLLPGSARCVVIVTSRHDLTGLLVGDGAVPISLDLLTQVEAKSYLSRRLGPARVVRESAAVEEIVSLCARLPLALAIVTARAVTHPEFPLSALASELAEAGGGLDAFDSDDNGTDVRRVFSWSQTGLSEAAAQTFRLLALHPGPQIGVAAASALLEQPPGRTRRLLGELARAHLVEEVLPSRFAFHDLLRAYAYELVEEAEDRAHRDAARGRMLDFYSQTAQRADRLLAPRRFPELWLTTPAVVAPAPLTDAATALDWFRAEHPALLAVIEQAEVEHLDIAAYQLSWALVTYFDRGCHWYDLEIVQRIALAAARRLGDQRAQAYAERGLARAYTWQRRYEEAAKHYGNALAGFESITDATGLAQTHYSLGWMLGQQDRFDAALAQAQAALGLFRDSGPPEALAETLNEVGWFDAQLGNLTTALGYCEEALSLHQQVGHAEGEAQTWDSLGFIHHRLGQLEEAITCYQQAVVRWLEMSDRYFEAAALVGLGEVYSSAGQVESARVSWQRAQQLYEQLADPAAVEVQRHLDQLCTRSA